MPGFAVPDTGNEWVYVVFLIRLISGLDFVSKMADQQVKFLTFYKNLDRFLSCSPFKYT